MSAAQSQISLAAELASICGEEQVKEDATTLAAFAIDDVTPAAAVSPGSAEEIAAILRFASEHDLVVAPCGGCTAQATGRIPERIDILLRTNRLNAVEHYDPGDLTAGFGAGTTLATLQETLAKNNQFLPLAVASPSEATIGGLLACAAQNALSHGYGGLRDFCIGIQFVTGDGKLAKGGGRVVKNVAGYDLMKLLIGSYGTLGVITSANFKVFPRPETRGQLRTYMAEFSSLSEAMVFGDELRLSPLEPLCVELVSPRALEYLADQPAPARNPDDFAPAQPVHVGEETWRIAVRAAGSETVLVRYHRELGGAVSRELNGEEESALWSAVTRFAAAVAARHRNQMLLQIDTIPTAVEAAILAAQQAAVDNNFIPALTGTLMRGTLTVAFVPLSVDPPSAMQFATAVSALRAALPEESRAIVLRCPTEAKRHFDVWDNGSSDFSSMQAVRRALDPKSVLNRGRFIV